MSAVDTEFDSKQWMHRRTSIGLQSRTDPETSSIASQKTTSDRLTFNLLFMASIVTFGTWFPLGYNIVALNGIEHVIVNWIRSIGCQRIKLIANTTHDCAAVQIKRNLWCDGNASHEEVIYALVRNPELDTIWALTASLFSFGGLISAVLSGTLIKHLGLRRAIQFSSGVLIVGTLLSCFSDLASSFEMLIVGRIIVGFAVGSFGVLTPMYISELTPVVLRGAVGTMPMTALVLGMIGGTTMGVPHILGGPLLWPLVLVMHLIPVLLMLLTLPFCPDSPRHLFSQKKVEDARKALIWLRNTENVQHELASLQDEMSNWNKQDNISMIDLLRRPFLRRTLWLCAVPMSALHLSGFSCLSFYSTFIFTASGLNRLQAIYASLGLWVTFLLANILSLLLVDRLGRRILLIASHIGVVVGLICLIITMALTRQGHPSTKYGSVVAIFAFIVAHAVALFSVPWILGVELFRSEAKAAGLTFINMVCWSTELVAVLPFPLIVAHLNEYTFLIFIACVILTGGFTFYNLPETKGKSIEQIQQILKSKFK